MNRRQNNTFRMSAATIGLMNDHEELTAPYAVVTDQLAKILIIHQEITDHKDGQNEGDTEGITRIKNERLSNLSERTAKVAKKLNGLARVTKDLELQAAAGVGISEIKNGSDQDTLDTVEQLLNAAKPHEAALTEGYNLPAGELAALGQLVTEINDLIDKRKTGRSTGKMNTSGLDEAIKLLKEEWRTMDNLIEGILDDQDFVQTYENTRRIDK